MTSSTAGLDRVVAVINGKGGVLKTSICSSLGALMALAGWRVLIVDLDPQGNLSEDLGLADRTDDGKQLYDCVPTGQRLTPQETGRDGLHTIHGGPVLHDLTSVVIGRQGRDQNWAHALANALDPIADDYDLILIDCPPGNETLQTLALIAARYVLIPTRGDSSSRKGLREVARRFIAVRDRNPALELLGVVITGITSNAKSLREEVRREVTEDLGGVAPVFETTIRYAERPAKAVRDRGQLPHELEPGSAEEKKALEAAERARRFARLREKRTLGKHKAEKTPADAEAMNVGIAPSTSGLAGDYADLAREFRTELIAAEERAA